MGFSGHKTVRLCDFWEKTSLKNNMRSYTRKKNHHHMLKWDNSLIALNRSYSSFLSLREGVVSLVQMLNLAASCVHPYKDCLLMTVITSNFELLENLFVLNNNQQLTSFNVYIPVYISRNIYGLMDRCCAFYTTSVNLLFTKEYWTLFISIFMKITCLALFSWINTK